MEKAWNYLKIAQSISFLVPKKQNNKKSIENENQITKCYSFFPKINWSFTNAGMEEILLLLLVIPLIHPWPTLLGNDYMVIFHVCM